MIRHKILDVWVKEDNPASQEVFGWFKYSIEKDYKSIEILSDVKTRKNEFIPVIKNIIGDFNLTNNIKS